MDHDRCPSTLVCSDIPGTKAVTRRDHCRLTGCAQGSHPHHLGCAATFSKHEDACEYGHGSQECQQHDAGSRREAVPTMAFLLILLHCASTEGCQSVYPNVRSIGGALDKHASIVGFSPSNPQLRRIRPSMIPDPTSDSTYRALPFKRNRTTSEP